jgi:hypothetical protein
MRILLIRVEFNAFVGLNVCCAVAVATALQMFLVFFFRPDGTRLCRGGFDFRVSSNVSIPGRWVFLRFVSLAVGSGSTCRLRHAVLANSSVRYCCTGASTVPLRAYVVDVFETRKIGRS